MVRGCDLDARLAAEDRSAATGARSNCEVHDLPVNHLHPRVESRRAEREKPARTAVTFARRIGCERPRPMASVTPRRVGSN